jgi:hypothetical protein
MERLLVIDFKDDPEFVSVEPQYFDDPFNGKGIRIIRYRKDKKVDVFWERGVTLDFESFNIGDGLGACMEVDFIRKGFSINSSGVQLDIAFLDDKLRLNKLFIKEPPPSLKRFPFLAPVGHNITDPKQFFLAYMPDFDFVKTSAEVKFYIEHRVMHPKKFVLTRDFKSVYFMRYAATTAICQMNPPFESIPVLNGCPNTVETHNDMQISFDGDGNVSTIAASFKNAVCKASFVPSLPNCRLMKDGEKFTGRFFIDIQGVRITGGECTFAMNNSRVNVCYDVTDSWIPQDLPLSFKLFTKVASFFRKWPSTYIWSGCVNTQTHKLISSVWRRK